VYHFLIGIGHGLSIVNGHSISAASLIPCPRTTNNSPILQSFFVDPMGCRQYQTTTTSADMLSHKSDESVTNNQYIQALSTEWTFMN
jgi:hypothetical protein